MSPNEELQPTAKKITKAVHDNADAVSLDQPFPDELPAAPSPPAESNEDDGKPKSKEMLAPVEDNEEKEEKPDAADKPTMLAGYKAEDLLAAPSTPPEPVKTEGRHATMNSTVRFLVALGVILLVVGLVLILFLNAIFGIIVMLLGGIAVIISVFAPLG